MSKKEETKEFRLSPFRCQHEGETYQDYVKAKLLHHWDKDCSLYVICQHAGVNIANTSKWLRGSKGAGWQTVDPLARTIGVKACGPTKSIVRRL